MSLRATQTLTLYLLVWAALGTVFSADVYEWPLVFGVYGATIGSLALPRGLRERWSKSRLIGVGLVLLLGSITLEILSGSRDIVSGATLFLVFVLISRLFTPRTPADATTVLTLSLVVVLAGSALNTSFAFAPWFFLVIVSSIWALTTTHLSRAAEAQPEQARYVRISRGFLATTSLLAVVIFAQTTLFFVIFPRMGLGYFKPKVRTSNTGAGFSDRVELGGQGTISEDSSVVLRLEFPEGTGGVNTDDVYFRGATLTQFDGKAWRRSASGHTALRQRADGTFPTMREPLVKGVHFTLYQEPGENEFLFAPEGTFAIRLIQDNPYFSGRPRVRFMADDRGDLVVLRPAGMALPLEGWLDPKGHSELGDRVEALELPADVDDRVKALAAEWRDGASQPKALAVSYMGHLANFRYTTEMVAPPEGVNPLTFFLTDRQAGHCEYFASALAVMLRVSGVPARVVNGYHGASFNRFGNYYAVQEYRAHSWVEYYDGEHWQRVDPTPPAERRDPEAVLERVQAFSDMLRFRWNRYVVEFDLDTQVGAVNSMRELFKENKKNPQKSFSFDKRWLTYGGLAVVALVALVLLRRRRPRAERTPVHAASRYFRRFEKLMRKRGLPERSLEQGPAAYLDLLAQEAPSMRDSLAAFGVAYLEVRFGQSGTEDALRKALENVARQPNLNESSEQ